MPFLGCYTSLGHCSHWQTLQGWTSFTAPVQYIPSCFGSGFEQERSRDETPAQRSVFTQSLQVDHSENCPLMAGNISQRFIVQ